MSELSYSFHIGNDKNKRKSAKKSSKNNNSKATSLSNTAIQNSNGLAKVNNHNLRNYDNNKELITTIYGTDNLYKDVQDLYKSEFDEARIEYNDKQKRNDRKIDNYFDKISKDELRDLAVEIIIELGDMHFWKDISKESQKKMTDVFKEQIADLVKIIPEFKLANATIHFDESSPHLHIVGVPIKDNYKNGMKKQVAKSQIFNKDSLKVIQDKMRTHCIASFNKVYGLDYQLKEKGVGRNDDRNSKNMGNYEEYQIKMLQKELKYSKNIIHKQKEEIGLLKRQVNFLKHLWLGLRKLFLNKIVFDKDKSYEKVADDLYDKGLFTKEEINHVKYGTGISENIFKDTELDIKNIERKER